MERDTDKIFRELTEGLETEFREIAMRNASEERRRRRRRNALLGGSALVAGCVLVGLWQPLLGGVLFVAAVLTFDRGYR